MLFDLDGTLVDSESLRKLRNDKQWKKCASLFGTTTLFDGIEDLLKHLRGKGIQIGVVTTSVSYYAAGLCAYHKISYDTLVAFHDARPKPAPDPFLRALERLGLPAAEAIGIGDDLTDSTALGTANIKAFGAGWNSAINTSAQWVEVLKSPSDVMRHIR